MRFSPVKGVHLIPDTVVYHLRLRAFRYDWRPDGLGLLHERLCSTLVLGCWGAASAWGHQGGGKEHQPPHTYSVSKILQHYILSTRQLPKYHAVLRKAVNVNIVCMGVLM